jgi:transcriptional regulator with XRE-family HTH domain
MTQDADEGGSVAAQWAFGVEEGGPNVALAERVRQMRKEHGWSQAELAERVAADPAQISRYEGGRITPSAEAVVKMAEAFDVSCDYLLVDDAPRRAFRSSDDVLGDRLSVLSELSEEDLAALLNVLDALVAKTRMKALTADLG